MRLNRWIVSFWIVALVATAAACQGDPNPVRERHPLPVGQVQFQVETVQTEPDREIGLMYRTTLNDDQGMLFVFDHDQQWAFWMKNTLIPLSIAYIDASGQIRQILDMKPQSLATVDSAYSVRYALEVPQGAFERRGVKVGDTVPVAAFLANLNKK